MMVERLPLTRPPGDGHRNHAECGVRVYRDDGEQSPRKICQFIHGEVPHYPDEPNFCGDPVLTGPEPECLPIPPYCEKHHEICHTRAPQPTERQISMSGGKAMMG